MFNFVAHLRRQFKFSKETFGPRQPETFTGAGNIAHIRKELDEVAAAPRDLEEWIDVAMLALDGAWRAGHEPEDIVKALIAKQDKNEARKWPDWRDFRCQPVEHIKEEEECA